MSPSCRLDERNIAIPRKRKIFYGVGHILNDLCSNCWFSYVLIYMTNVAGLSNSKAGLILLIGQLADALSTVIVGWCCDRTSCFFYGKRKIWHAIGTVCVIVAFPFVFNLCIACKEGESNELKKILYYGAFVILFQFGWACTQIAHLALIPEIATNESQRVELNAIRSGLTFACGVFVFCVTWSLLGNKTGEDLTSSAYQEFMILSLVVVGVGATFSLMFHVGTPEKKCKKRRLIDEEQNLNENTCQKRKSCRDWLKDGRLYKTGLMFMCTRLTIYVFQAFFAIYLTETLHFKKEAIAYFPLILLVSGAMTSLTIKFLSKRIGSKLTYVLGSFLILASSIWLFILKEETRNTAYGAAWLTGSGGSIILVASLAKTADVIGADKDCSAFVYSTLSCSYKVLTGVVIFGIQQIKPTTEKGKTCEECEIFSKLVQTVVPALTTVGGLLSVIFLFPSEFECRRKGNTHSIQTQTDVMETVDAFTTTEHKRKSENDDIVTWATEKDFGVISLNSFELENILLKDHI